MKIDRVILAVNNNKKYTSHWNLVSPIWKNNFNIKPTLVFYGTNEEFESCNFNIEGYDYFILPRIDEFSENNPDWVVTWSLFYISSKYSEEVCMISGIDQIPLSNLFFKKINEIHGKKFVVGFYDAYLKYTPQTLGYFNTQTNVLYPSSHLVGYGKVFKEIFEIEDVWYDEIKKVYNSKNLYYLNNNFYTSKMWGIDECYASHKISKYVNQNDIEYLNFFWDWFQPRRIDLDGKINTDYCGNKLLDGYYSEVTCKNSGDPILNQIVSNIKKVNFNL